MKKQGSLTSFDPVFTLSGDKLLEVFSDTAMDPWSMLLPDVIFVGPLVAANWG